MGQKAIMKAYNKMWTVSICIIYKMFVNFWFLNRYGQYRDPISGLGSHKAYHPVRGWLRSSYWSAVCKTLKKIHIQLTRNHPPTLLWILMITLEMHFLMNSHTSARVSLPERNAHWNHRTLWKVEFFSREMQTLALWKNPGEVKVNWVLGSELRSSCLHSKCCDPLSHLHSP